MSCHPSKSPIHQHPAPTLPEVRGDGQAPCRMAAMHPGNPVPCRCPDEVACSHICEEVLPCTHPQTAHASRRHGCNRPYPWTKLAFGEIIIENLRAKEGRRGGEGCVPRRKRQPGIPFQFLVQGCGCTIQKRSRAMDDPLGQANHCKAGQPCLCAHEGDLREIISRVLACKNRQRRHPNRQRCNVTAPGHRWSPSTQVGTVHTGNGIQIQLLNIGGCEGLHARLHVPADTGEQQDARGGPCVGVGNAVGRGGFLRPAVEAYQTGRQRQCDCFSHACEGRAFLRVEANWVAWDTVKNGGRMPHGGGTAQKSRGRLPGIARAVPHK
ncbi:MAG: hypothetical protein RLZZ165_699 [Bacteroidota bacterium]